MEWKNGEASLGTINNTVEIIKTTNEEGIEEKIAEDNKSGAEVIIAIATGEKTYIIVILAELLIAMIGAGVIVWKRVKRED